MDRAILLIFVAAIIGTGLFAGGAGLFVGNQAGSHDSWSPREYVAKPGDCFVPPQGDPLYDEHYAKNVNVPNCQAFENQADAKYTDAQTEKVQVETRQGIFGVLVVFGVVAATLILVVVATVKK